MRPCALSAAISLLLATGASAKSVVPIDESSVLHSTSSSQHAKSGSPEFYLYGGPGSGEGRFETALGDPDWQGWTTYDPSYDTGYWQVSTFHADNLNDHGAGNRAYWCGHTAEQEPTWTCPPGYGNNWHTTLQWTSGPLADPSVEQTVGLDFFYNLNSETGYDYFFVEYDSAGTWTEVYRETGTHFVPPFDASNGYPVPGRQYSLQTTNPIVFAGSDYGGPGNDEIRLRFRVYSDCCHSAQDCFYINAGGFLHVDDVSVTYGDGVTTGLEDFSDFEGPGPFSWVERPLVGAFGDFAKLYAGLTDIDPCADNSSWQVTFLDDGTPPSNLPYDIPWPGTGSVSPTWSYGAPGGWVTPRVSSWNPNRKLENEIWSPPIAWDLPGTADDAAQQGAILALDVWRHLPIFDGVFWTWWIRTSTDGVTFGSWVNDGFVYYSLDPEYTRTEFFVGQHIPGGSTHVQIALAVLDVADLYGLPGDDETPSPWFDNVSLRKFATGPYISARSPYLLQDTFPPSGTIDTSDLSNLACNFDMASTAGPRLHGSYRGGDSLVVDIKPIVPGTTLVDRTMNWILDVNPRFTAARTPPPGTTISTGTAANGWDQWMGSVDASLGYADVDAYSFDMPYEASAPAHMFFPGDFFRYYVQAQDSDGRVTTLPADLTGFADGVGYDGQFAIRALPTIVSDGQVDTQPRVLFVNDSGLESVGIYRDSFAQLGMIEGVDFDAYTVRAAFSNVGNSLPSEDWPANTMAPIAGYDCILYEIGNLRRRPFSAGGPLEFENVQLLHAWHSLPGDRYMAHFGDDIVAAMLEVYPSSYVQDVLAVQLFDDLVTDEIGGQLSPPVVPVAASLQTTLVANGGCPQPLGYFNSLRATAAGVVGHEWGMPGAGSTYSGPAASVIHDRMVGSDRRVDLTVAFGLQSAELFDEPGNGLSGRAELLRDVFAVFGSAHVPPVAVDPPPPAPRRMDLSVSPNPFNPAVTIRVQVPERGRYTVQIYDVRGQRVVTLHDGVLDARPHVLSWQGLDADGVPVASGVYLAVLRDGKERQHTKKMALLR